MSIVYLLCTYVTPAGEEDFNRWQQVEHIPALLAVPGYLGVQRFVAKDSPGAYLNV